MYVVAIIFASTFHDFPRQLLLSRVQLCMLLQSFCIGFPRLSTTVSFESCLVVYVVAIIFASTFHDFPRQLLLSRVQLCMSLQSFSIGFSRLSTIVSFRLCLVVYVVAIIQHRLFTKVSFESCLVVYVVAIIQYRLFTTYLLINRIVFVIVEKIK